MARPSCIFSSIIFLLILLSVGVLVFVLKFQHSAETSPRPATTRIMMQSDSVSTEPYDDPHEPWLDFRLPTHVVPSHYDLLLYPQLENDTFFGTVNITVSVNRDTRYFIVHAHRLTITECGVYDPRTGDGLILEKHFTYAPNEYFVLETRQRLRTGRYILRFEFSGNLTGSIVGFYKSNYRNRLNESRSLATSKFQPTYARRAFPCFDEPSFKTTFSVSLMHSPNYIALSNMPVQATKPRQNSSLVVTTFQKSVPMVTYLVCFIVCDFKSTQTTANGKQFRVYSSADQVNKTKYALKFGARVLEYYETYFNIEYPLPKQDMIAIPDFVSGAMEHWGIITFRETSLLYDESKSSPSQLQRISAVISHEMAHMWFGNLVTMEWWDDVWINEGFASYVEYKGLQDQHPEWDIMSQFVSEDLQPVMNLDSTMSSHPIVQSVKHPDEITAIFDSISYKKGASILRMMEFFIGEENFRNGISNFLRKHKYKNAKTLDLWNELSAVYDSPPVNHTILEMMKTWTEHMGFPCVTIDRDGEYFVAHQKRFLKNEELHTNTTKDDSSWSIPLSYVTANGEKGIIWIHDHQKIKFTLNSTEWVKFNINQTGFYVVNYSRTDWQKLIELMHSNHEVLTPSDRSNLLFDSFLLAEAGYVGFEVFLSLTNYLKKERHLVPWYTAYTAIVKLCHLLKFTDTNILLKNYIRDLTDELYKDLGWESSENHLQDMLRTTVIGLACYSGNQDCLTHAAELFQNWTRGHDLSSNLRKIVFRYGMAEIGKEEHWNYMWSKYLTEESAAARGTYLYGLACTKITSLLHRYIEYAMDEKNVRSQDFFGVLISIAGNSMGRTLVWNFVRENWPRLVERFTLNDRTMGFAIKAICSYFTTPAELEEMKSFFAEYPDAGAGKRGRQQALETVQNNIRWLKTYKESIKAWLEKSIPWYHHRLPSYIVPEHYDLLLHPMLEESRFRGTVAITVELQKPSDVFIVHAKGLNVTHQSILSDGKNISLVDVFQHEENDYLVLKVEDELSVGEYKLYFEFEGLLSLSLQGLYRSSYFDPVLQERSYLATTQFEPTSAREAFPCFDEPHFKTTFNISVLHTSTYFALSNAILKSKSSENNGLILSEFEETPPMVTYLLCVVVCDFQYRETFTESGIRMRAYSAPHLIDKTEFALNISSKILVYFEKYFNISFPLKKLDMIAVPDFLPNGMENWGLITYDEEIMIVDNEAPDSKKLSSASIIAHELAHMWFGDLVTMEWWNDLWLNEGFATFVSWKGTQHAFPHLYSVPGMKSVCFAMENDQFIHSHPVVQSVTRVTSDIFDSIAYSKGSSILRMLESYMGDDFRKGVTNYLKKYSFKNARTDDLWKEFSAASKEKVDIGSIMDTWTKQMNYPYITVKRSADHHITLQQNRFLLDPLHRQSSPFNWKIPISFITSTRQNVTFLLLDSKDEVSVHVDQSDWFKLNVNFTGYYSVNYEEAEWRNFIQMMEINHTVISSTDRVNLLFDAFNLAEAGLLDYSVPLNLTRYLKKEEYHEAWRLVLSKMTSIRQYFINDREMWHMIKEYVRSLSKDLYKKIGWNETGNYLQRELRKEVLKAACDNNNYDCLESAATSFKRWMKGEKLSPELSSLVYEYGVRYLNDEESFLFLWNSYLEETDPFEKSIFIHSLPTVKNISILERLVRFSRNESYFRKSWQVSMLINLAKNPKGHSLVANYIFHNWTDLVRSYGISRVEKLAFDVFSQYQSEKDLDKVREFYGKRRTLKEMERLRSRTLEAIRLRIKWHINFRSTVAKWFQDNVYMPWSSMRLPRHIKPSKYDIVLKPNVSKGSLEGEVRIELMVTQETDYILLHQNGLKITHTECPSAAVDEAFPHKKTDFWVIRFNQTILPGNHLLHLNFKGSFSLDGMGVYHYTHRITGEKRTLLATQFEATYARRVFPCFDEPDFKASFKISIIHDENYTALSNMPQQVRAYAPPDRIQEADRSLKLTVKFLEILEDFFDVPYHLPKLDSVAIPSYTVPGMEHWGIITYNAKRFLEDGNLTSHQMIVERDRVIAHELVHQWFGNLVTMKWWNDVWLNEGVATLIMYVPLGKYYPAITEVDVRKVSKMMCTDSNIDSNPILRNVTTPKEISEIFDAISYEKGGAVMKMLQHTLKDDFRKGLTSFLKKYAFKNADTNDLWEELMNTSSKQRNDVSIAEMMDTWTRQMGFPYVQLKRQGSKLYAEQRWFLRKISDTSAEEIAEKPKFSRYGMKWKIPLVYKNLNTGKEETLWLIDRNATFDIDASDEDVVKFNPDFVGFYVVKYDSKDYSRLGKKLMDNHEELSTTDRYNVLHDAFLLAETDRLTYDVPMELTKYLRREREALPWTLLRDHFIYFLRMLQGTSQTVTMLKEYVQRLTYDLYEEYVWNTGSKSYFQNRKTSLGSCSYTYPDLEFVPTIVDLACRTGNQKCLHTMHQELQLWMLKQNTSADLSFIFKVAVPHYGNETLWQFLYEEFIDNETSYDEKLLLAEGLVAFTDPSLISKTLDVMMWHPNLDVSLIRALFQGLGDNPIALPILWNYAKSHWLIILNRLEASNSPTVGISVFCDNFKTLSYLGEFVGFLKRIPMINDFVMSGCMEEIQSAINWSEKYEETLKDWVNTMQSLVI
nr:uncharacterized protein LOC107439767 isoform X3 [Parasteatoda tepidariorum]